MNNQDKEYITETISNHKICVVIPTFNNAGTLHAVITEVLKYCPHVIVVNDGSTDSTSKILESFSNKINIVSYNENKGKGTSLKRGFEYALKNGFEYAITIDSDGQHYADDIPNFAKAIIDNPNSIIIGERDLSQVDINGRSSFANKFSNFWFTVQTGKKLKDTQTGYRAYPLKKLYGLSLLTSRYEAELELLVFAAWNGVDIVSIPIRVYYPPQAERISHFKPALDFTRISILNTILCVAALIYGFPMKIWRALTQRRLFSKEFRPFTRKRGDKKEAATTLGRLASSIYGMVFFLFLTVGIFTPLIFITFGIGKDTERKRFKLHLMLQRVSNFLTKLFPGAKVVYENAGHEDFEKPAMIICNHQSHLDLPVLMSIYPKLIFLTNDWVWNNAFYGRIIHRAEFLPVSAGMDVIIPRLRDLKDRGYSIVVFPEGTRSEDCRILRFHQGAFHLAKQLELDIVPMTLHGAGHYLPKTDFMLRKGVITLRILNRVPYNPDDNESMLSKGSKFRKLIREEYNSIALKNEKALYFKSLVGYKYAYRGWWIVSECKKILKKLSTLSPFIDNESPSIETVRIINGGIGVFPLLYALVNKDVQVFSFEEDIKKYKVAGETSHLPKNLHIYHPVWSSDYFIEGVGFDKTIILDDNMSGHQNNIGMFDPETTIRIKI